MARPRLFYILDSLEENEVGEHVLTLLSRMSRARFEPRVVALGPEGSLDDRLRDMKVTVHRLDLSGPVGVLMAVPRLRRLLSGLNAELLQTFQPWSGTVAQLGAPAGTSVFRWVQGLPPSPTTLEDRLRAWLEHKASTRRALRFVVSDAHAAERVRTRYGVDHVDVVPQCLDLGPVRAKVEAVSVGEARIRLGLTEGQRVLVAVSDFRDRGRMAEVLDGFATALRERPDLRLFVAGRGPEEGAARGHAEELHLEDAVIFLGTTRDRPAVLRVADVVVDVGSWPGWSRCSLQAMAVELPVLRWVSDEDDPDAQRYPARTTGPADRFARDVLDLLEDQPLRARLALRAAQDAKAYDVTAVVDHWARIYGE